MSFLITGCGRSGTGWAAAVLRAAGAPCGHEEAYGRHQTRGAGASTFREGPLIDGQGESSWLAVPHLDELPVGTRVLWLTRDPYAVVASATGRRMFTAPDDAYARYVARWLPWLPFGLDPLGAAIGWAADWDTPCWGLPRASVDGPLDELAEQLAWVSGTYGARLAEAVAQTPPCNAGNPAERRPTREEIEAHPIGWRIRMRAVELGYPAEVG